MAHRFPRSRAAASCLALLALVHCGGSASTGGGHGAGGAGTGGSTAPGTGGSGGSGAGGTSTGSVPCTGQLGPHEECRKGLHAPVFQSMPAGFFMDTTEVTRSQYAGWLATGPKTAAQAPECQWNQSFAPDAACVASAAVCASQCDAHPQVCVDWCDAAAFCAALGKQLCGARPDASSEGPVGFADFNNPEKDQFQYACSADGKLSYIYGDTYDAKACHTGCTGAACTTIEAASDATCQGADNSVAFPGVFDLDGNVAEWDGLCDGTAATSLCHVRGGDMTSTAASSRCDANATAARATPSPGVGFRCCSGP